MNYILQFHLPVILSLGLSWFISRQLSGRFSKVGIDKPDSSESFRKSHEVPTPRTGGLAIFLSLLLGCGILALQKPNFLSDWFPLLLCCFLIFMIGFIDDLHPLGAKVKLLAQIIVALIAYSLGLSIEVLSNPLSFLNNTDSSEAPLQLAALSLPLTVFWFVAITNIINLIDGMDGLASGLGMFLCLTMAAVGWLNGQVEVAIIALIMAGSLIGFLFFNMPPAKIYLGDGGAYLLGFFVAGLSTASSHKGSIAAALMVVMVALGLPILDASFAILRRGIRGLPLFRGDAQHIHHRLLTVGLSKNSALIALYSVCGVLSLLGLSILWSKGLSLPIVGAIVFLLAAFAARYLGYISSWKEFRQQLSRALARRHDMQHAILQGQLLEMEIDRCTSLEEFLFLYDNALDRLGLCRELDNAVETIKFPIQSKMQGQNDHQWQVGVAQENKQYSSVDWKALAECLLPTVYLAEIKWGAQCLSSEENQSKLAKQNQDDQDDQILGNAVQV